MSEAGYTLVEALAALLILGLAMGGLSAALQVWSQGQSRTGAAARQTATLRQAQATFSQILGGHGPFRSSDSATFTGAAHLFRFDCGRAAPCTVQLLTQADSTLALQVQAGTAAPTAWPLPTKGPAHFQYDGDLDVLTSWPPAPEPRQGLHAVAVVLDGAPSHAVLLESRLWTGEAVVCAFDAVLQDCR